MLNWIIDVSLRHRFAVMVAVACCAALGVASMWRLDIDAFPDTTPVQVQINTVAPSLSPEEIEIQVTALVEQSLSGLPRLGSLRSISKFGMSQVVATFEDGVDIYFARQLVNERLSAVAIPASIERPRMGPVSTGLGEVFHYIVTGSGDDVTQLRTIHDWVVKPQMRTVKGTAEVVSWGGFEKQYQIRLDATGLIKHGLTYEDIIDAVTKNNGNVGGGAIRQNSQMLLVQGAARTVSAEEIRNIVVRSKDGVPTRIGDVAEVAIGAEVRRGAVTANGKGEVVLGLGFMLMGENSHEVTWNMKRRLEEVKSALPRNVHVEAVYDRTELVGHVIDTVRSNLFEGGLLVIVILFAFLGNLRAAFIVALAIPLSMLFAFSGMLRFGIAASLLSLGAIDFGLVVDSSVVMVENCVRHIAHGGPSGKSRLELVRDAAVEVRRPTLFGELIIMIVYLPILTLEGIEGKLFRPMALTVIFALMGSMVLSLTLMPVLASLLLPRRIEEREPWLMRLAHRIHAPILRLCMHHKSFVLGFAGCVLLAAFVVIAPSLGTVFVPRLSEGAICINIVRLAGTDLNESIRLNTLMERALLKAFPNEVQHVWSRIGSAEIATDPMGVELTDLFITLKPRTVWKKASNQDDLTRLIERELRDIPGQINIFLQPIEMRMAEMTSGVRSAVAVKIFGDDMGMLLERAAKVEAVLRSVPGNEDVAVEQVSGQPVLQIRLKQEELARYGVSARVVLDFVESLGSKPLGEVVEGQLRFPLIVRLPDRYRNDVDAISGLLVPTSAGEQIPLSRLARVQLIEGPSTITREWGQRRITVTCNVRDRDLGGFIAEARRKVAEHVPMAPGRYRLEWGGEFEQMERANLRLLVVVPLTLALIFGLLYLTYGNVMDALRVLTGVPFAWVGGVVALWLRDMPFSISAAVGFIALSGVAVLDDMILVSRVRQLRAKGLSLDDAVQQAAISRLRPVLMTTLVASLGFVPMALSTGVGAEVQRPLATVIIGGVLGAMVMSLLVLRVLYVVFQLPSMEDATPR